MKLTEVLISILIISIVVVSIGFVYSSYEFNGRKSISYIKNADELLIMDNKIRDIICNVKFSYLENGYEQIEEAKSRIENLKIKVTDISFLKDRNDFVCGMKVFWSLDDSENKYITQDLFLSKVICSE